VEAGLLNLLNHRFPKAKRLPDSKGNSMGGPTLFDK